jgi:uncharacterized protein (TIGR02271 family)
MLTSNSPMLYASKYRMHVRFDRPHRMHPPDDLPLQTDADIGGPGGTGELRIPVIHEELDVAKQVVETGRLRIHTHVTERHEAVQMPLDREEYTVERVAVGRPVDTPVEVRQEGEVTIVPVHEEEIVVTRRLVLKEELHIRRRTLRHHATRHVTLRTQEVEVVREPIEPPPH